MLCAKHKYYYICIRPLTQLVPPRTACLERSRLLTIQIPHVRGIITGRFVVPTVIWRKTSRLHPLHLLGASGPLDSHPSPRVYTDTRSGRHMFLIPCRHCSSQAGLLLWHLLFLSVFFPLCCLVFLANWKSFIFGISLYTVIAFFSVLTLSMEHCINDFLALC